MRDEYQQRRRYDRGGRWNASLASMKAFIYNNNVNEAARSLGARPPLTMSISRMPPTPRIPPPPD